MTKKLFPIMFVAAPFSPARPSSGAGTITELREAGVMYATIGVPWGLMLLHEDQVARNHHQTVDQLAKRGGLTAAEAVAVLEDRSYSEMNEVEANVRLARIVREFGEY